MSSSRDLAGSAEKTPTLSAIHRSFVFNTLAGHMGSLRATSIFVARCSASNSLKNGTALATWVPKEPMRHNPPISAHLPRVFLLSKCPGRRVDLTVRGPELARRLQDAEIRVVRIPECAPNPNAYAERFVR